MASNEYKVQYSINSRAGCKDKDCKEKIEQGEVRIAKMYPSRFNEGELQTDWFHAKCIFNALTRARTAKKIESPSDLEGFDDLKAKDQEKIKEYIAGKGVGGAKKKKAAGTKRKKAGSDDDEEEEKPKKKKAAPKKKAKKGSDADEDEEEEEKKPRKKSPAKKKKKAASDDEGEESEEEKPKKKKQKTEKPAKKASGGGGGGSTRLFEMDEKFWEVTVDGADMTVRFGKIGANGQSKTTTLKDEAAAEKEAQKLIKQKEKKGYELQG